MRPTRQSGLLFAALALAGIAGCAASSELVQRSQSERQNPSVRFAEMGYLFEAQGHSKKAIECYRHAMTADGCNPAGNDILKNRIASLQNVTPAKFDVTVERTVADVFRDSMEPQDVIQKSTAVEVTCSPAPRVFRPVSSPTSDLEKVEAPRPKLAPDPPAISTTSTMQWQRPQDPPFWPRLPEERRVPAVGVSSAKYAGTTTSPFQLCELPQVIPGTR
jgi:hypothetical protein